MGDQVAERERDPARTRRTVLDAAARVVAQKGAGVSIDTIARAAGVSKGGLLHHFHNRDELVLALTEDLMERFAAEVRAAVDPTDRAEGRLMRGYIRASFDSLRHEESPAEHVAMMAAVATVPGVAELLRRDKARWEAYFADDGLDPQRTLLIFRATDGAAIAGLWEGGHSRDDLARAREMLLALTRDTGPVV
ncbi:TetR family transcriptional regulator [Kineosporia sp. J2-2]|uniref:TetR family transcriptional regulator n=1 Tax=Kineosporia corallincola TaxID=2835133 RepID=A0ABS5TI73_9ACTN|nr:TetR/AcrR family transcriptional regulator [Kineosporia corallincola]MBT0770797.1 TetR family transcriptional regulator [Kineosporia corallincola]